MKSQIALTLTLLVLIPASRAFAGPPVDPAKEADIRHLLDITGSTKMAEDMMNQMANQLRPLLERSLPAGERNRQIADTFVEKFLARTKPDELIQHLIPIYDKHLTDEEIKGLIQFYETPLGQHYVQVLPEMMKESYSVSAQWGQEIAKRVIEEMQVDYPELKGSN